jgi:hypothetical protein
VKKTAIEHKKTEENFMVRARTHEAFADAAFKP